MKKIVALVLSLVMVLGLATTAFGAVEAAKEYDDLYVVETSSTDPADDAVQTDLDWYKEVAVKYNKDGERVENALGELAGKQAYFTDGTTYYLQVPALAAATHVAYIDEDCEKVKFYLLAMPAEAALMYSDAVAFTNIGDDCGEYDLETMLGDDFDADAKYYAVKGIDYNYVVVAVDDVDDTEAVVKVGTTFVNVAVIGDVEAALVEHKAVIESEDGDIVKVYCSACDALAAKAPNMMSVPEKAVLVEGTGAEIWYWTSAVAAPEASDKVESAETFDAGIAMYVGMSVMAAAGSAVVLKKKD